MNQKENYCSHCQSEANDISEINGVTICTICGSILDEFSVQQESIPENYGLISRANLTFTSGAVPSNRSKRRLHRLPRREKNIRMTEAKLRILGKLLGFGEGQLVDVSVKFQEQLGHLSRSIKKFTEQKLLEIAAACLYFTCLLNGITVSIGLIATMVGCELQATGREIRRVKSYYHTAIADGSAGTANVSAYFRYLLHSVLPDSRHMERLLMLADSLYERISGNMDGYSVPARSAAIVYCVIRSAATESGIRIDEEDDYSCVIKILTGKFLIPKLTFNKCVQCVLMSIRQLAADSPVKSLLSDPETAETLFQLIPSVISPAAGAE